MAAPVRASNDPGADDDSGSVDKQKDMLESTNQFAKADQESSEEDDGPQFEYPAAAVAAAAASPAQKSSAVSDLIFSSDQASHQFNHILTALKRANLSMHNRLRSIQADALFVQDVQRAYYYNSESIISTTGTASTTSSSPSTGTGRPRPLVANERCGSWYIPPGLKRGSAYFKSTDGHHGIWAFSARRLNLHLLDLIGRHDGCIVVDSTRRGKRMPDALSKTVPMWCCVVNNVLFPDGVLRTGPATLSSSRNGDEGEAGEGGKDNVSATEPPCYEPHRLYTPPNAVSASEHAQMESRVPAHADALRRLGLDLAPYRAALRRPIRPVWVTQESRLDVPEDEDDGGGGVAVFEDFHPVICCTSSRRVAGGEMSEGGYIQGAGDDTENWAFGLTPPVFWANADLLLSTPEAELPDLVRSLVDRANAAPTPRGVESDATAVTAPGDEASSLSSLSLAPILSRYQQVAPEIYVARTADLDPRLLAGGTSSTFIPFPKVDKDSGNSTINNDNENNSLCTIVLHQQTPATDPSTWAKTPTHMDVGLGGKQSKIASRNLRAALPQVAEFVREFLEKKTAAAVVPPAITATIMDNDKSRDGSSSGGSSQKPRILIACDTGRDLSVGVALALVCQHCCTAADAATTTTMAGSGSGSGSGSGGLEFRPRRDTDGVNKTLIKSRLGHIMARFPDGNPSRATLQSVNSYLMG